MNKANFREMTRKQLRDYILQNRGDPEAIHALHCTFSLMVNLSIQ
ncbi:DUF6887 family protein [Nostoc flagelliforme]|nr:hypothetical protein [Nostoc flagelliforme]